MPSPVANRILRGSTDAHGGAAAYGRRHGFTPREAEGDQTVKRFPVLLVAGGLLLIALASSGAAPSLAPSLAAVSHAA